MVPACLLLGSRTSDNLPSRHYDPRQIMEKGHPFSMYALEGGGGVMKINAILRTQMHLLYIILYVKCIQLEGGGVQKLGKMCVHSKWMAPIK